MLDTKNAGALIRRAPYKNKRGDKMFDIHGPAKLESLLAPAARVADENGAAVNVRDYIGIPKVILDSAIGTGTTPTLDVKLQDSADGSTGWTDITGAVFTQVTDAAAALEAIGLKVDEVKEYIRAVVTITGTGPSFTFSVHLAGRKQVAT